MVGLAQFLPLVYLRRVRCGDSPYERKINADILTNDSHNLHFNATNVGDINYRGEEAEL